MFLGWHFVFTPPIMSIAHSLPFNLYYPSISYPFQTPTAHILNLISIPSSTIALSMWNPNQAHRDDDDDDASWEIRAFAEDTMGTTWPPRFYNCTFCGREFKSAQALGGHMNVHRRDRVRFRHENQPISSSTSSFTIPATNVVYDGGGVCFFYQLPNENSDFLHSISLHSATPYPSNNPIASSIPSLKLSGELGGTSSSSSHCSHMSSKGDESLISIDDGAEKLDLELRLGQRPSPA